MATALSKAPMHDPPTVERLMVARGAPCYIELKALTRTRTPTRTRTLTLARTLVLLSSVLLAYQGTTNAPSYVELKAEGGLHVLVYY